MWLSYTLENVPLRSQEDEPRCSAGCRSTRTLESRIRPTLVLRKSAPPSSSLSRRDPTKRRTLVKPHASPQVVAAAGTRTENLELIKPARSPIELRRPVVDGRTYSGGRVGAQKTNVDAALRGRATDDRARSPRFFGRQRRIGSGRTAKNRFDKFRIRGEDFGHLRTSRPLRLFKRRAPALVKQACVFQSVARAVCSCSSLR